MKNNYQFELKKCHSFKTSSLLRPVGNHSRSVVFPRNEVKFFMIKIKPKNLVIFAVKKHNFINSPFAKKLHT